MNNNNIQYSSYPPYPPQSYPPQSYPPQPYPPPNNTKQIKKEQILDGLLLGSIITGVIIFTWIFYAYKVLKYSPDRVGNLMVISYGTDPKVKDSISETEFLNFGAVNIDIDGSIAEGEMQIKPSETPKEIISSHIVTYNMSSNCADFSTDCINV